MRLRSRPVLLVSATIWFSIRFGSAILSAAVFSESGFPAADSAPPSFDQLRNALSGAHFANADQLAPALEDPASHLLVLLYGSAPREFGLLGEARVTVLELNLALDKLQPETH